METTHIIYGVKYKHICKQKIVSGAIAPILI
jgi:hypothetical protein